MDPMNSGVIVLGSIHSQYLTDVIDETKELKEERKHGAPELSVL